ncbi:MAG: GAF domain-containing protein, partial [Candidatus Omnitrophota bacterium]
MAKNHGFLSLSSRGLRHKLMISAALMSVLPLLVSTYLVSSHILPRVGLKIDIIASLLISIFIAIIGFFVTKEVFDRVLSVTSGAKMIAEGDVDHRMDVSDDDEVGDLGNALNILTQRIRSNMDELKTYGEKTSEINLGIQKRVVVLSSLLQISSQIALAGKLDEVLKVAVEKAKFLANSDFAYLFFREDNQEVFSMRVTEGANSGYLWDIKIGPSEAAFYDIVNANKVLILDKQGLLPENLSLFIRDKLKLKNTLILPIYLRKRVVAILGIGNMCAEFSYTIEDIEMLDIFAKQVAIAVENDKLTLNVKKLEVKDTLTGLYNETFMRNRLQEEIKRAIAF